MIRRIWQLLLFLTLVSVGLISCAQSEIVTHPNGGVLTLGAGTTSPTAFSGRWEYYPHALLYPLDFDQNTVAPARVGSPLSPVLAKGGSDFGTYRISIENRDVGKYYGVRIPKIGSAEALWIDGQKAGQSGTVGDTLEQEVPGRSGITALFSQTSGRVDLVLQVSDFHRAVAFGTPAPVLYGTAQAILDYGSTARGVEIALLTLLCILGLIFLVRLLASLRENRRSAPAAVLAVCVAGIARLFFLNDVGGLTVSSPLLSGLGWTVALKLSLLSYFLLLAGYAAGFLPELRDRSGRVAAWTVFAAGALCAAAAVFVPISLHGAAAVWGGGALAAALLALLVISLVGALRRARSFSLYSVGTIVLVLAAANDLTVAVGVSPAGFFGPVAVCIFAVLALIDERPRAAVRAAWEASGGSIGSTEVKVFAQDIRRPLRSIVGLAESLLSGRMGNLEDDQVVSLSLIAASGLRLSNVVSDLVDRDRIRHNSLELELSPVSVESLVERVSDYLRPLRLVSSVELKDELPRDLPTVNGDRRRIEQIIYNVLAEALRHRGRGVVTVAGELVADQVRVSVRAEGGEPSSDGEESEKVPESPAAGSAERSEEYAKLSMEVAAELVRLQGGRFTDNRNSNNGRFEISFSLPKSPEGTQAEEAISEELIQLDSLEDTLSGTIQGAEKADAPSGFRILVADGDLVTLQTLRNHLLSARYRVRAATNGEEVLVQLESSPPDLLLIDATLPKLDGFEVCRRVRKRYTSTELPILILVDKDQLSGLVEGMTAGASDFISKPVVPDEFLARVRTHINLAKMNNLYSRFVPVELLHFLGHDNVIELQLGDQIQREMTILFVDIRAFTNLSEGMTPQENFKFINSYLARITPIIRENNGFIDKYIGDAILALYPGSPEDALRSAIRMVDYLQEYNGYRRNSGYRPINIGIGIHTGNLIVGIIGDSDRMQGTVISDAVNLASRVQDVTKLYGANIIISQDTFIRLENPTAYNFRFLGKVKVKGKNQTVSLFEVFDGEAPERVALKTRTKQGFEDAILMFAQRRFAEASEAFRKISTQNPNDRAAALFLNRSEHFLKREKASWLLK